MDPVDLFDDIIEYDADGSSEKENEESQNFIIIRQPKTTKDQFNRIASFTKEHDETLIDKVTYDSLWQNLAASLNYIGPPDHTASEWRRIWSAHKHNMKRKRLVESTDSENEDRGSIRHLGQPSSTVSVAGGNSRFNVAEKLGTIENQSELSMKMDVVIENQTKMIANQKLIIRELQSSNKFLQEISKQA